MKTDVITVSGRDGQAALDQVEKVAAYKNLPRKNVLHLLLLTEETMGMMRSITGEPAGKFWIEDDENGGYTLHLRVVTRMDSEKREQLLEASTSGRNESARGLMGRLRDFFDRTADEDIASMDNPLMMSEMMYDSSGMRTMDWEWSMLRYEQALSRRVAEDDEAARQAWDELEKSVVAHVADDVKVSIRGSVVEMTIFKKFA